MPAKMMLLSEYFYSALTTPALWRELERQQHLCLHNPKLAFDARTQVHLLSQMLLERAHNA